MKKVLSVMAVLMLVGASVSFACEGGDCPVIKTTPTLTTCGAGEISAYGLAKAAGDYTQTYNMAQYTMDHAASFGSQGAYTDVSAQLAGGFVAESAGPRFSFSAGEAKSGFAYKVATPFTWTHR